MEKVTRNKKRSIKVMKARSFYIGVLSILFTISSFNAVARNKTNQKRASEIMRKIEDFKKISSEEQQQLRRRLAEILEENPEFNPATGMEINIRFLRTKEAQSRTNSDFSKPPVSTPFITSDQASAIVDIIVGTIGKNKVPLQMQRDLKAAIQKESSTIGPSLLKLATKMENTKSEDVEVIVQFAANIRNVRPETRNTTNPEVANILLDLGQHLHEIPSWDAQPYTTVMNVLKTFNQKYGKKVTTADIQAASHLSLKANDTIGIMEAFHLAIIGEMITVAEVSTHGLTGAIRRVAQKIREKCER